MSPAEIEEVLLGIFQQKNWIINEVKLQCQLYEQHLASQLRAEGIVPPDWLTNPNTGEIVDEVDLRTQVKGLQLEQGHGDGSLMVECNEKGNLPTSCSNRSDCPRPSVSSASSYKGIPNTNSKYREDKQVSWHSTPFETRLERALEHHRSGSGSEA